MKHNMLSAAIAVAFAGVAGQALALALGAFTAESPLEVTALPATELSGFGLVDDMADTLVVAISQSGTTTDTNRTVDLVRSRGAAVIAIVNRRNSDLTDRSDGVLYTSDGRDVEMSVASTKAFYAQIAAGFLLAFAVAEAAGVDVGAHADLLAALRSLPGSMEQVLARRAEIAPIATRLAPTRRSWAVVGNGRNRIAAHEVRIKLSELCYKSIACDATEDKKHIDLSAEPLVIVCAAGLRGSNADDVAKEIAIYGAHKAAAIAVVDEGDDTALNPNYRWTVTLTGAGIAAKFPTIGTFTGLTVLARNGFGEWGGRVTSLRVEGTAGSAVVTGAQFRSKMGLRDTLFSVRATTPVDPPPPPPVVDLCDGRNEPTVTGAVPPVQGTRFTPISPVRLIDTRKGVGTTAARLKGGCTLQVDPGLDPSVASVAVNLTSVKAAANGFVVAYPCGVERPVAAAVQSVANKVVAGMTVVPLGADGTFCVYSYTTTDMVIDLFGTYAVGVGAKFQPVSPTRLFDSRTGAAPIAGGSVVRVKVSGKAGTPTSATAASLTVHALTAARDGYATAFPCGAATPPVASLAVNAGGSVTNHVETAIANGEVCVFVSAPMHLIVDLSGWYGPTATTEYFAITPVRAVDTRSNVGITGGLAAKVDRPVTLAGTNGLPSAARVRAVVAQVIAVGAAAPGYLTVHPCLAKVPSVSMVRYVVGSNAATSVSVPDDASGRWCVTASSAVHLVVDLSGYFA